MKLSDMIAEAEVQAERLSSIGDEAAATAMRLLIRFARGVADALAD